MNVVLEFVGLTLAVLHLFVRLIILVIIMVLVFVLVLLKTMVMEDALEESLVLMDGFRIRLLKRSVNFRQRIHGICLTVRHDVRCWE